MYFELWMNSDYEQLITEDEILITPDIKPQLPPATKPTSILDPDYEPPGVFVKEEPPEQDQPDQPTHRTIGELITQLDYIAKVIKQELIDTTAVAWAITHKHSSSCDLNKYVEMHGGIGSLQIKDVRSLVRADQAVFPEMIPVQTEAVSSSVADTQTAATTLPMVPPDLLTVLPVVTNTHSTTTNPMLHATSADNSTIDMPLPMVTPMPAKRQKQTSSTMPLHMVTTLTTASSSTVVSTASLSLPITTDKPIALKWSRVLNRPVEADPTEDTMSTNIPPTSKITLPMVTGETQDIFKEDPKTTTITDKYYEVLNPEQDYVVFISHSHIMNTTCTVQLERLSDDTQYMYKTDRSEPSPQSSSTESTETSDSITPKKKPCYWPKRKPSKARIRAQKIVVE